MIFLLKDVLGVGPFLIGILIASVAGFYLLKTKRILYLALFAIAFYYFMHFGFITILIGVAAVFITEFFRISLRLDPEYKYGFSIFLVSLGLLLYLFGYNELADLVLASSFIVLSIAVIGNFLYEK
jgi:hypothetical protein